MPDNRFKAFQQHSWVWTVIHTKDCLLGLFLVPDLLSLGGKLHLSLSETKAYWYNQHAKLHRMETPNYSLQKGRARWNQKFLQWWSITWLIKLVEPQIPRFKSTRLNPKIQIYQTFPPNSQTYINYNNLPLKDIGLGHPISSPVLQRMRMEIPKALAFITVAATILGSSSVEGQTRSPCTASMINNFTPCFNVITGSSNNGSSQKESCCTTLRSLSGISMDCACLLLTANVPVPLPINAALALILPTSCNIANLPNQCKGEN